ncbi:ABC transporter ATP-binding protein [Brytella acorum]|uniref:ABC transporter ATP-binding protein n=1 Tax=Brytella acorum TaxID=2959299 RepID=A0AA35XZ70_9PROT|nr:ABC transporter ATP-binding protein [Brytella acorum]MDF3625171.1 ABC transporter ATP-binding protein [Brytella acorum]CAI9122071.1 ABC transporter ATP-binding protein [Brytella acorum]
MKFSLEARDLNFVRGGRSVLKGIDFHLRGGEMVGLLGINGAGKSTFLRLLLGLLRPSSGQILLDGVDLQDWRRREIASRIAYVPQAFDVELPFTVREMVTLGRAPHPREGRFSAGADRDAVDRALTRLALQPLADRPCAELSGGERQRVMLARALAQETPALVLDEPTNGLDYGHQIRLLDLLRRLADEGRTILLTSHHPEELYTRADRVAVLKEGDILADGRPDAIIHESVMSALYAVPLAQIDHGHHRFFHSRETSSDGYPDA